MTKEMAEGFLHLLKAEPELLDPAPAKWTAQALEHRRHDEIHPCLHCGEQANCAYVTGTRLGPRWLDLCWECSQWIRLIE